MALAQRMADVARHRRGVRRLVRRRGECAHARHAARARAARGAVVLVHVPTARAVARASDALAARQHALRAGAARRVVPVCGLSRVASASSRRCASDRARPRSRKLLRDARAVGERGCRIAWRDRCAEHVRGPRADRAVVRDRRVVAGSGAGHCRSGLADRRELDRASRRACGARVVARYSMRRAVARVRRRRLCGARACFGAFVPRASRGQRGA